MGNCFHLALRGGNEHRNTAGGDGDFTSDFEDIKRADSFLIGANDDLAMV